MLQTLDSQHTADTALRIRTGFIATAAAVNGGEAYDAMQNVLDRLDTGAESDEDSEARNNAALLHMQAQGWGEVVHVKAGEDGFA